MKKQKNKIVKIGIVGIGGKMGKAIAKLALQDPKSLLMEEVNNKS